jgi:hypothetical protein
MEGKAVAAVATRERRDGWNVAGRFDAPQGPVGDAAVSHQRKTEIQGDDNGTPDGTATRINGAWHCVLTPTRALVIGGGAEGLDVTGNFCAMTIVGPMARETIARFCALDLRQDVTPVRGLRPGSVARTPGFVIREDEERYLLLVGSAYGEYLWTVVADAAAHLGGGPIGVDDLLELPDA